MMCVFIGHFFLMATSGWMRILFGLDFTLSAQCRPGSEMMPNETVHQSSAPSLKVSHPWKVGNIESFLATMSEKWEAGIEH